MVVLCLLASLTVMPGLLGFFLPTYSGLALVTESEVETFGCLPVLFCGGGGDSPVLPCALDWGSPL